MDEVCAICRENPAKDATNLAGRRLMTNVCREVRCGHRFCTRCIGRALNKKSVFACPEPGCGATVRNATLDARSLDEIECERDAICRRKVIAVFNRPKTAFRDAREYGDYTEKVEDSIYRLSRGGAEAKAVEDELKAFQVAHNEDVAKHASRHVEQQRAQAIFVLESKKANDAKLARERGEHSRLKRDRDVLKHETAAYMLGDRATPPSAAHSLPQLLELRAGPVAVQGAAHKARRAAGGWSADALRKRAVAEMLAGCADAGRNAPRAAA
ncbi:hypothetical protein M885DRAFT_505567 [Pelagophyceae sp. CCMP2097]|nr:hypothetical protein M885DRAFT_505567 [Pelagophyceae sp. CCMP2097]